MQTNNQSLPLLKIDAAKNLAEENEELRKKVDELTKRLVKQEGAEL